MLLGIGTVARSRATLPERQEKKDECTKVRSSAINRRRRRAKQH